MGRLAQLMKLVITDYICRWVAVRQVLPRKCSGESI